MIKFRLKGLRTKKKKGLKTDNHNLAFIVKDPFSMPVGLFEVSECYRKYGELKPCDSWVSFYLTYSSYVASDILQILTLNLYRRNVFSRISGYTLLQH